MLEKASGGPEHDRECKERASDDEKARRQGEGQGHGVILAK